MTTFKRSVIVTGGTMNMGYHAALAIARKHPEWLVVVSSRSDPNSAADKINSTLSQKNAIFLPLDLSSTANIRQYVKDWTSKSYPPVRILLLNAALQFPGELNLNKEGIESTFAITHVGHALLFHLLAPHLASNARIMITASGVHDPAQKSGMPDPQFTTAENLAHPPPAIAKGDGRVHYVNAKLSNIFWTYALQRRLDEKVPSRGITVSALDPGLMPGSGLARSYPPIARWIWNKIMPKMLPVMRLLVHHNIHSPQESGAALATLALDAKYNASRGKYFEQLKTIDSSAQTYEVPKQDDIWSWTVKYVAQDAEEALKFERFE